MKNWDRFLGELGSRSQVYVVGPLLQPPIYRPQGPTIYVDGGSVFRPLSDLGTALPSIAVGDGDSGGVHLDISLPKEKDFSDLAFVLRHLPVTVRHVELFGFLGGRRDHELANFGETHKFLSAKNEFTTARFDESIVAFSGGSLKIQIDGRFSVMVLEESVVTVAGACKYSLPKPTKFSPASSFGLSNEGTGAVLVECDKPCFLFLE